MSLVGPGIGVLVWRKARRSVSNGDCVEVAPADSNIFVRDSKNPGGATLGYPPSAWRAFIASAKSGNLDILRLSSVSQGPSEPELRRINSSAGGPHSYPIPGRLLVPEI